MTRCGIRVFSVLLLVMAALGGGNAAADSPRAAEMSDKVRSSELILLRGADFDPAVRVPLGVGLGLSAWRDRSSGRVLGIIQFASSPRELARELLADAGVERLYYIPNNAYLVRFDLAKLDSLAELPGVRAVFRLPKWARVDPKILDAPLDSQGRVAIEVSAAPGRDAHSIAALIAKRFADAVLVTGDYHHERGRVIAHIGQQDLVSALDLLAGLEDVLAIDSWQPKELLNDNSIWVGQSYDTGNTTNYDLSASIWNQGLYGDGQIVCVNDSGLDTDMCTFRYDGSAGSKTLAQSPTPPEIGTLEPAKKVIAYFVEPGADAYDYAGSSYHGTHVTGSVAGDNWATPSAGADHGHDYGDGMAPRAQIVFQDVGHSSGGLNGLSGDLSDMFQQAYDAGARIHSDSWGSDSSAYDTHAMDMDEFMFRNQDFLFVVAMGNSGTAPGDGSIGSPATAKGIVSVGATTNGSATSRADNLMSYSRGPVDDGRLKPDIVSPGSSINSASGTTSNTDDNCSSKSLSGTSMATPTTSGYLALLRQYFSDGFYPTGSAAPADARTPSGALMKAVLTVGGMPLGGTDNVTGQAVSTIPSLDQGWGRTHLDSSLFFAGDERQLRLWDVRHDAGLATGEQVEFRVAVPSSVAPLNVRLVWSDPESTTLSLVNLVNNLDLEVVAPGGAVYRGNVFAGGVSTTGGAADVLNPIEGVVIAAPAVGEWTLRVRGSAVPGTGTAAYSDRQGYALVATFSSCSAVVAAPADLAAVDNPPAGVDLSWSSSGASDYLVYRAPGLAPDPEQYTLVGVSSTSSFTDLHVQGGFDYSYVVRASDGCAESPASNSAAVSYTGACTLFPDFDGVMAVTNDLDSLLCDLVVEWGAAASNCPAALDVSFNIYRGTDPYFSPAADTLVATTTAASYTDYDIAPFETYYYVVRAEDSTSGNGGLGNDGNEETNSRILAATAWAPTTSPGTFTDDGGDTNAKLELSGEWRVTNQQNHSLSGSFSYHNAPDGGNHGAGQCAAATTPPMLLQAGSPALSYWTTYNIEVDWDGVVVEVNDCDPDCASGSWTPSTPVGGYPGDFSQTGTPPINACGYAATQGCFNGPAGNGSLSGWQQYTHDLTAWAGSTVQIRWSFSSDGGFEVEGFYLDDIEVTQASVNDDCSTRNGRVQLDAASYGCAGLISVSLGDSDLSGQGTHSVSVASDSEPGGELLSLLESPAGSGAFSASIATTTAPAAADGLVTVADGDTITVSYVDADDGLGGIDVVKTDTAVADCQEPQISAVSVADITATTARVLWTTDEEADSLVSYGLLATPPPSLTAFDGAQITAHSLTLQGLTQCTDYAFFVSSSDAAGNQGTDDNGGAYYSFGTPQMSTGSYDSDDTPLAINDLSTFSSTLTVPVDKTVVDVDVQIDIAHTYDSDLDIYLISPLGTAVELTTDNGSSGDNFAGTIFDDEATTLISSGVAPFSGSYRPEGSLAAIDGESSLGDWQLQVGDDAGGDTGTLNWWKLTLSYPFQACGPDASTTGIERLADGCNAPLGGDGIWDPGEQVQFALSVHNTGTVPLTNVSATLTPLTAGATMIDATASFGDIAVETSQQSAAPHFTVQLPADASCGSTIDFQVDVSSDQGSFQDSFAQLMGEVVTGDFVLLDEDFDGAWGPFGDNPPSGWSIIDNGDESAPAWNDNDWHRFAKGGVYDMVARVYYSPVENQDEHLVTPSFHIPAAATAVALEYDHYFNQYSSADSGHVEIFSDQLGDWVELASYLVDTADMEHATHSLLAYAGHSNVQLRFRYLGNNGWYWQVDNVRVAGSEPGGCNHNPCSLATEIFSDGFESGTTAAWSASQP